jgi:ribonuclease P protein component
MRSRDVQRIRRAGRQVRGERMVIWLAPGTGAAAVIAGRRVGGAVERNRARRVLRAALREVALKERDVVASALPAIAGARTPAVASELKELLDR